MISCKQRNGKELCNLNLSELIEEVRAMNIEGSKLVHSAMSLNLSGEQYKLLNEKVKEFEDYKKEVACEFIGRFLR